jgi:hypothetical protein
MTKGTGFTRADGCYADVEQFPIFGSTAFPAGYTIGLALDLGDRKLLRLTLDVSAKSGTNPTLDVVMQTAPTSDGPWRSIGTAFNQMSDVGLAMGAVAAAGTTPPTVTLSGTADRVIDFRMECTTLGARGTAVIRYSIDGGGTWTENVTTAATIAVGTTGLTINYASATAAVDNVWTAKTAGREYKVHSACDRWVRPVCKVGGTSTPIVTASLNAIAA